MADVTYVLPDTVRAPLRAREECARSTGCDLVEVAPGEPSPPSLPWVLRIPPAGRDGYAPPRWHDGAWTSGFARDLAGDLEGCPSAVVIEPGPDRNRPADLVRAIEAVRGAAPTGPAPPPSVLVAHRPGQAIPDGAGLAEFWAYLVRRAPALAPHAGLALDPSALYAAARTRTAAEVARIPPGAVRYLRVHWQGERPDLADPVPWRSVFRLVRKNPGAVLVAPAVLDPGRLEAAILFCMVMLQERAFT